MEDADSDQGSEESGALREETRSFEDLLRASDLISKEDPKARWKVQAVLRDTITRTPGEAAQIVERLSRNSGMAVGTAGAMLHDELCTFSDYGVLATPRAVAQAWLDDTHALDGLIVHTAGSFYVRYYNEDAPPCYLRVADDFVEENLLFTMPNHPLLQRASGRREIVSEVMKLSLEPRFFDEELPGLQMKNGFLTIDMTTGDLQLLRSHWEIRSRWTVPANYTSDALCDVFEEGLARAMPDQQSRASLLEKLGAAVMGLQLPGDNANSITLLVGPPRSGKSTIVKVLEMLVPEEMRAALQPADMSEKFMATALDGKRLNLVPELDISRTLGGPVLKAVTSRETVTVRGIRENPRSMTPRAAQVLVSNEIPRVDDKTGAYRRRISLHSFPRSLSREEVDPTYLAKLEAELSGIVVLLARNVANAVARGFFLQPTEQDELMAEMRRERDIVTQAISERVERKPGSRLSNRDLFDCVRAYAASKDIDLGHLEGVALGRRVAKAMREQHRTEQVKSHGVPTYDGVRLKIGSTDTQDGLGQMDI